MSVALSFGNTIIRFGNYAVSAGVLKPTIYALTCEQTPNGYLTGAPASGEAGQVFTLLAEPSAHYHVVSYSANNATLTANSGTFINSDVTAKATFAEDPKYNATLQTNGYGAIAANKTSGYSGDTVTLSNTPSADCIFANYEITGATLTGNQFNFGSSNVTAKANFNRNVHSVTVQNDGHGTVTASPSTGYSGTQVTLSNTPAANYGFSGYTITGATLTGNKFNIGTSNVTAKAWFSAVPTYALTTAVTGNGTIQRSVTGGQQGAAFSVTATANNGNYLAAFNILGAARTAIIDETGALAAVATGTFGTSNVTAMATFEQLDPYLASAVLIGDRIWMSADFNMDLTGEFADHYTKTATMTKNGITIPNCYWYDGSAVRHLTTALQAYGVPAGWRIPTQADWQALFAIYPNNGQLCDTSTWTSTATWGSTNRNISKLSLRALGYYEGSIPPVQSTTGVSYWSQTYTGNSTRKYQFMANDTTAWVGTDGLTWPSNPIRLVKDA